MQNVKRGFTLLEMVMVLVVSGLMVGFLLQDRTPKISVADCALATKTQLNYIRARLEAFARDNDRLPLPAKRYVNPTDSTYGREAAGADITQAAGVSFGALPFQVLGLDSSYAGDCWGNKFTYAVTTALTTDSSSGGYMDSAVEGNITLLGDGGRTVDTEIAYAVISHGEDALGAVKLGYTNSSAPPDTSWCTGSTNIAYTNCLATAATLQEGTINNGKDAGANYFDDLIVYAGKPNFFSTELFAYGWGNNPAGQLTRTPYLTTPRRIKTSVSFTSVAAGLGSHACGLTAAGAAYCWGFNQWGQLGDGTTTYRSLPTAVSGGLTFTSLSVGNNHTCGLTSGGAAYCWGVNTVYQLGDGTNTTRTTPTLVSGGLTFTSLALGASHSCGLSGGVAYCWGGNGNYQLGDGTNTTRTTPTAVSPPNTFASLAAGSVHTCGLTSGGAAYCWGGNGNYQLGDGTNTTRTTPTAVVGPGGGPALTFTSITTRNIHTCGVENTGAAYCWGANTNGQLGDNSTTTRSTPTALSGGLTFASLTAGTQATCGQTNAGTPYCWGENTYGQLGNGTTTNSSVPVAVFGGYTFTSLLLGDTACGVTSGGVTYCWGNNDNSQLSLGVMTASRWDVTPMEGGLTFTSLSSGRAVTCGLTSAGAAYCWGANSVGGVGDGTNTDRNMPAPVSGGLTFTSLTAQSTVCGLTGAGVAYCWGDNTYGTVGDGTNTSRNVPTAVSGGLTFSTITTGMGGTACGITTSGAAYCWGYNLNGQIGDGTTSDRNVPTAVSGGLTFSSIAIGNTHTCGLTSAGAAYCWGSNISGRLGDSTTTDRLVPTAVSGGLTFTSIKSSSSGSCALTSSGAAYCWGTNTQGQMGDGTWASKSVPTAVTGGLTFASLWIGNQHSCGITSAGTAYCWGRNNTYQLGDGTTTARNAPTAVSGGFTFSSLSLGYSSATTSYTVGLVSSDLFCTIWSKKYHPGHFVYAYQSAAPAGACQAEYRTCSNRTWDGSYTEETCTPGCDARTVSWGVSPTCSGPMSGGIIGGGAPQTVFATSGGTGDVTVNCSASGVLTLSGATCTP